MSMNIPMPYPSHQTSVFPLAITTVYSQAAAGANALAHGKLLADKGNFLVYSRPFPILSSVTAEQIAASPLPSSDNNSFIGNGLDECFVSKKLSEDPAFEIV